MRWDEPQNDWAWNRFRRRVDQVERGIEGVYHEFTGIGAIVEQLARLEYDIELVHNSGFIARRHQANPQAFLSSLHAALSYPYLPSLLSYVDGESPRKVHLT